MVRVVRLERTVSWSQTRRDTNFAIPGYSISTIIPRRGRKSKIFLSVVIYVVKAVFVPLSAAGAKPANARVARLCGVSPYPVPDTATVLPKQARYQLRYTRLLSFLSGWAYSPKPGAIPTSLYPEMFPYPIMFCRKKQQAARRKSVRGLTFLLCPNLALSSRRFQSFVSSSA